jgi:hypothetical protein
LASGASLNVEILAGGPPARSSRTSVGGSEKPSRSATAVVPSRDRAIARTLCTVVSAVGFPAAASIR